MTQPVSTLSPAGFARPYQNGAAAAVDLQARLNRYQKQLSDCVDCASAKTPKGKADIDAIRTKIDDVEREIAARRGAGDGNGTATATAATPPSASPLGGNVDTFA